MAKLDLLRKLIREEVENAIRKEVPKILREIVVVSQDSKAVIKEVKKPNIPGTLNTKPLIASQPIKFNSSNPLSQLLNETALGMSNDDVLAFTSDDIISNPMSFYQSSDAEVGSVVGMLQSARGSSTPELVQINEVPSFHAVMEKLKQQGQI